MKFTRLLLVLLLLTGCPAFSQSREAYDLAGFSIPHGWKKITGTGNTSYTVTDAQSGTYARIILYKSLAGSGDPEKDFEVEWRELVRDQYKPSTEPETKTDSRPNDWKVKIGYAPFTFHNRESAVSLITLSSQETKMSIVLVTNTDQYQKQFVSFVESLELSPAPIAAARATTPDDMAPADSGNTPRQRLVGKWNRSGASHPHYADPASWGTAGYTTSRYEFKADGSYIYTERSFRMSYQYIIIVKENGRYSVNGNTITIVPEKSIIQRYSKKNNVDHLGQLEETKNRPGEKVTYNFTFHYFSGIQEWNLVLQAPRPTLRDGNFSSNDTYPNAWYFDQKYINNDLTSAKGE